MGFDPKQFESLRDTQIPFTILEPGMKFLPNDDWWRRLYAGMMKAAYIASGCTTNLDDPAIDAANALLVALRSVESPVPSPVSASRE